MLGAEKPHYRKLLAVIVDSALTTIRDDQRVGKIQLGFESLRVTNFHIALTYGYLIIITNLKLNKLIVHK